MSQTKPREVYLPVHVVDSCNEVSECTYFEIVRVEKEHEPICIARCKATNRYLTRSAVRRCISYWRACPFKIYADSQLA